MWEVAPNTKNVVAPVSNEKFKTWNVKKKEKGKEESIDNFEFNAIGWGVVPPPHFENSLSSRGNQ